MNEEELIQKTRELISRWDNVRVVGLGWSGDPRRGFQFNPTDVRTGGGGSGGTPPPPTTSGACCPAEGSCFIATQAICESGGGTYQGDDTTCDPDPCTPTGACCHVDGTCTSETEAGCDGAYQGDGTICGDVDCTHTGACCDGVDCTITREADCTGTYQGDGTTCDPNPCVIPPCNGCPTFTSPYLPGRFFLSLETHGSAITHITGVDCSNPICTDSGNLCDFELECIGTGATSTIDPITCVETDVSGTWNSINNTRSVCVGTACTAQAPFAPVSGTYAAGSDAFCSLNGAPLVYSATGTTVHGTYTDTLVVDCGGSGSIQYDLYHVYGSECTP